MVTNDQQFLKNLEKIASQLESAKLLINDEVISNFQKQVQKLNHSLVDIKKEGRNLQIGIVGEVKAGKSSFINALIFNGESVLPKAPTPMTAALTKISYSDQFEAKIVFYTEDDWRIIKANAAKCDEYIQSLYEEEKRGSSRLIPYDQFYKMSLEKVPKEYAACKELIEMAEKNQLNINEFINSTAEIAVNDQEQFISELNLYVGAEGKYTPIVKYTEIKINNPILKNIEIIDTPGMNDPIVSRTMLTSDFLIGCDIVFFLSYTGQFLNSEEMSIFTNLLPQNSVQKAVLIGSKYDSGILDYKERNTTLKTAVTCTKQNLERQAKDTFEQFLDDPNAPEILKVIAKNLPPIFTSGLFFTISRKIERGIPLTKDEEHILKQFEKRFEGFERDSKLLRSLSNIDYIQRNVLVNLVQEKREIIGKKAANLLEDQRSMFIKELETMNIQARSNLNDLQTYDVHQLQQKVEKIAKKLDQIRTNIQSIFANSSIRAAQILNDIQIEIEKEINNYVGLTVSTKTDSSQHIRWTGFLGLQKEYYTVTTTTYTSQVQDAVASIRKYITRVKELINHQFKQLFDLNAMKREITEIIIGAFDLVNEDYNEREILLPLNIALGKLSIPDITIDNRKYDQKITGKFSRSVVEGSEISELMLLQEQVLLEVSRDIQQLIKEKTREIERLLDIQAATFVDSIEELLKENVKKVQTLLLDKENNVKRYEEFIENIKKYKQML